MPRFATRLVGALVLCLFAMPALGWGPLGHRLVAALAWDDLDPAVRAEITALLAGEPVPTLPGIASWADDLRANDPDLGRRSAPWHYVNLGELGCRYDAPRACPGGDCVVEAIGEQAAILGDRARPAAERLQALKFVVHFVGDVHQPMHAGNAGDRGGNDVQVNWPDGSRDGKGGNLHSLWDSGLFNTARLDESQWLARLRSMELAVPLAAGPERWAEQSCKVAMGPGAYPAKAKLGTDYLQAWRPVAEQQVRAGGSHLAMLLNATLGARD
ncbi:S1/P1 nuclease [Lysobacter sp. A3-1-A15]|uniref:S1/P1 nuclease n=1 Tax=Novilysobacter viscosus TaxID=3098602 RepID=UPI002ED7BB70